ncbi:VWA domain-containing protein, partial [Winogradskyella aurantiaca]|uniref:VWA domain-containing protein n=1 Tax=Winogradskyella aurantiaca TaxID=2219558 RepID=UPI0018E578A2
MSILFLLSIQFVISQNLNAQFEYVDGFKFDGKRTNCTPLQNPAFSPSCNYRIILILDESGSIKGAGSGASDIEDEVEDAVKSFVESLTNDCLDIDLAIIEFGTDARRAIINGSTDFTALDDDYITNLNAYLDPSGGNDDPADSYQPNAARGQRSFYTNWDQALYLANSVAGNSDTLIVLFTDGNPTTWGIRDGSSSENPNNNIDSSGNQTILEEACESANLIKSNGNRLFTVGLPNSSLDEDKLDVLHNGNNSIKFTTDSPGTNETNDIRLADYLITDEQNVGVAFSALATAINQPTIISTESSTDLGCNPVSIPIPQFTVIDDCLSSPPATIIEGSVIINGCSRSKTWTANYSNNCYDADEVVIEFTWTVDLEDPSFDCPQEDIDLGENPDQNDIPSETSVKALVENGSNELGITAASDDCEIKSIVVTADPIQTLNCVSTQVFNIVITDNCDKTTECSITYTWSEELPDITFNPIDPLCEDDESLDLVASPSGGSFSGQGMSGNTFNPSGLSGIIKVTYTYADENGCESSAFINITVNTPREAEAGTADDVCGISAVSLNATANGPGSWSGGSGTFADSSSTSTTYTPDATEIGTEVTLTWTTDADGVCEAASDDVSFNVDEEPVVDEFVPVQACEQYQLPPLTNGDYFTGPDGSGDSLSEGALIDESQTIYIYSPANGECPAVESSFVVTISNKPEVSVLENVDACGEYTLVQISSGSYFTGPDGTGDELSVGSKITETQTIFIYLPPNGECPAAESSFIVTIDTPREAEAGSADDVCGISAVALSATANGPGSWSGGSGTFADTSSTSTTYTPDATEIGTEVTLTWTTDADGVCEAASDDVSFDVDEEPEVDQLADVTACEEYTLPQPTNGSYYTQTNGGGDALSAGDTVTDSQTIYIYLPANGECPSAESSFVVTIDEQPEVDQLADVTACEEYTLLQLTNGSYFTQTNGGGDALSAGDTVTDSQTIYIYLPANGECPSTESSFVVTIECEKPPCEGPDCEEPRDPCENYSAFYVDNAHGSNQGVLHGVNFTGGE